MEDVAQCAVHCKLVEYMCPACKNLPLCETCKRDHETVTRHAPENCKEVGLALMHQRIQDAGGKLANGLAKEQRKGLKELEAELLREIDRFQSSCMQTEELRKMRKLESERRYIELYSYAKSLHVGWTKNEAAMGETNKRLLEMIDKASAGLKKVLHKFAVVAQHKPVFAAYNKGEVFIFEDTCCEDEEVGLSALHSADMSTNVKALYIDNWLVAGDRVASELASRLQTHPVSALYFSGHDISDAGAKLLAQTAFCNNSLSAFCIMSGSISDTGAKAVAEAARNCRSLTTFYIHSLKISDSGAKAVAEAAKDCPLSAFYLGSPTISDSGAIAVAEAVKDCSLSAFCLMGAKMSDAGAIAVAKMVKDCPLSAFYLGGSKMSDAGVTAVADAPARYQHFAYVAAVSLTQAPRRWQM